MSIQDDVERTHERNVAALDAYRAARAKGKGKRASHTATMRALQKMGASVDEAWTHASLAQDAEDGEPPISREERGMRAYERAERSGDAK